MRFPLFVYSITPRTGHIRAATIVEPTEPVDHGSRSRASCRAATAPAKAAGKPADRVRAPLRR